MNWWRQSLTAMFRPASPEVLAARELDEARRQLLAAQSAEDAGRARTDFPHPVSPTMPTASM